MRRLLKISFDIGLLSLIPVLSWILLGIIVDPHLINVFTLTYPIQFVWYIFKSIFATGANISKEKDKNPNAVMAGLVIGSIVSLFVFGCFVLNIESYIRFMNMEVAIYKEFAIYSVIQLYIQLIFEFILVKLYYEEKNDLANHYSIYFNLINFVVLIACAFFVKDPVLIVGITLVVIAVYTVYLLSKNVNKFKWKFNLFHFIRYDSVELTNNIAFFLIFLFGFSNSMVFGEEYISALTFVALITDVQWDVFDSIVVTAQIDISKGLFYYREHVKNAYKLLGLLILSVFFMFSILYPFYELSFGVVLIYLSFELINYLIYPIYRLHTCFLQLEYSASKTTANKMLANVFRIVSSFIVSPFCTGIGQIVSSLYQFVSLNFLFHKNYKIGMDGLITKRKGSTSDLSELDFNMELENTFHNTVKEIIDYKSDCEEELIEING